MFSSGKPESSVPQIEAGASPLAEDAWLQLRLKVRPDLQFSVREQAGKKVFLIGDPVRNKYFQIGELERRVLSAFDGTATVAQVAEDNFYDAAGQTAAAQAIQIAKWLVQYHLATVVGTDNSKRVQERARILQRASRWGVLNLISIRLPLFNPTRLLDTLQPLTAWLFHPLSFLAWLAIVLFAGAIIWERQTEMSLEFAGVLSGQGWIWLLAIWSGLKVIHELAHGLACRRFGGGVPEGGILLLLLTPLAYVNVTSSWKFSNRWQRMVVVAAGMYAELFIAAIAAIAWAYQSEASLWKDLCLHTFIMASVTTVLFNANPLMKFDGYYLLSDLVEIPNLYGKSNAWLWDQVRIWILGWRPTQAPLSGWTRWVVPIYGVLAAFWRILVSLGLLIGAGVLFHGAGLVVVGFAIFSWYLQPALKQIQAVRLLSQQQPLNWYRVGTAGLLFLAVMIGLFLVFSSPASKSAPAIVRFENETILRAGSDGFVRVVHVRDGDQVLPGQVLAELENLALSAEVVGLQASLEESRILARKYLQSNELAKQQAELERRWSLESQLAEKQSQLDELKIKAPCHGVVLQRNLEFLEGCFLKQGEAVLTVADSASLEIVASIEQDDYSGIGHRKGDCFRAVFAGAPVTGCELKSSNPTATTSPVHEALCASYGGPLPVKPRSVERGQKAARDEVELLTPRFNLELEATPLLQSHLKAGQRGRVVFPVERYSLGAYWYLSASRWVERKVEAAWGESVN